MEYKSSEESSNLNKSKPKHKKVEFDLGEANNTIKSNRASQESLMESMELDDQTPKKIGICRNFKQVFFVIFYF